MGSVTKTVWPVSETSISTTAYQGMSLSLRLTWTSNGSVANTSTLAYELYLTKTNQYTSYNYGSQNTVSLSLNGTSVYSTSSWGRINMSSVAYNGTVTLTSGSITVAHNSDGTKSVAYDARFNQPQYSAVNYILTGTQQLDTIPRQSTFTSDSPTSFTLNSASTIKYTINISGAKHRLRYWVGNAQATIATGITTNTKSWTPPLELAAESKTATTLTGTLYLDTYASDGTTLIGTVSQTIKLTIPSSVKVTISSTTPSEGNTSIVPANPFSGTYVQGKSKIKVTVVPNTAQAQAQGATVKSCTITIGGTAYTASQSGNNWVATSNVIGTSGSVAISATITDTRGRTSTSTTNVTVTAYSAPTVKLSAFRSDSSGTADDAGEYIKYTCTNTYTSLSDKNPYTLTIDLTEYVGNTQTTTTEFTTTTSTPSKTDIIDSVSTEYAYVLTATVSDHWTSISQSVNIGTAFVLVDYHSSGKGIAFGKVAQTANLFEDALPAQFDDHIEVVGDDADCYVSLQNGSRKVQHKVWPSGHYGIYDPNIPQWILRANPAGSTDLCVGDYTTQFKTDGEVNIYNGQTIVSTIRKLRFGSYVYRGDSATTVKFTPTGTPAPTLFNLVMACCQDAGEPIRRAYLNNSTGEVTILFANAVTVARINYILF